jgi:hypothetical protein
VACLKNEAGHNATAMTAKETIANGLLVTEISRGVGDNKNGQVGFAVNE